MKAVFLKVLELSLSGSILIAAVLFARLLLRKAPRWTLCLLWLLVGLRLALPFEIRSHTSVQPEFDTVISTVVPQQSPSVSSVPPELMETMPPQYTGQTVTIPAQPQQAPVQPMDILPWVWILGISGMLGCSFLSFLRLKRRVRESVIVQEGIWICTNADTAFVLGLFKPQIYLPAGLNSEERELVISHERTHISRLDHWTKVLFFVVLSVHWFNPLVWLSYGLLCRDMEMACDEKVIRHMDTTQRKAYSAALLRCGAPAVRIAACPVAFGEISIKQRIKGVLNYRKPGFWIVAAVALALVIVILCFLTSPAPEDPALLNADTALETISQRDTLVTFRYWVSTKGHMGVFKLDASAASKILESVRWRGLLREHKDYYQSYVTLKLQENYSLRIYDNRNAAVIYGENIKYYRLSRDIYPELCELLAPADLDDVRSSESEYMPEWGISMTLDNISPTGARLTLRQDGTPLSGDIWFGSEFWLEALTEDGWTRIQYLTDFAIFTAEAYSLGIGGTHTTHLNWDHLYGSLSAGTYCLGKTLSLEQDTNASVSKTFYVEFTVTEESAQPTDPTSSSFGGPAAKEELIRQCRDAMAQAQNSFSLWLYATRIDGNNSNSNVYSRYGSDWMFEYRDPDQDYDTVKWLCYDGVQYLYDEVTDEAGNVLAPYRWQIDPNPDSHTFALPYPFDLDWYDIELEFRESQLSNSMRYVTLYCPDRLETFVFCFYQNRVLQNFEVLNDSGKREYICALDFNRALDELGMQYRLARNEIDLRTSRDDAFYEELFTRKTDGIYTTRLCYELFVALYQNPEEFVQQLYRVHTKDPEAVENVFSLMSNEVEFSAPGRFLETIAQLRQNPNVNQQIVERLAACYPYDDNP